MVMKILLSKGMKYFVFNMDMEELVSLDAIKCSSCKPKDEWREKSYLLS